MSYDPNSPDSMFTRIMEKLDAIDERTTRIETQVNVTNGRVSDLERWRDIIKAHTKLVSAATSAVIAVIIWIVDELLR
jgi:uncharacterized protein YdcH (DUF465 family)